MGARFFSALGIESIFGLKSGASCHFHLDDTNFDKGELKNHFQAYGMVFKMYNIQSILIG